ncbi:beta-N-acetylglucosaminidase domain-containing protein [Mesomycoplasma neurolyticum]|uniref:Hyaluronoglucosaminidase n=1 Tax=Mesomycoplasma neurolyticum TaxID=2120 RepID=A0A449A572_9BACT|nr:beta-N-acetylglucosaminidase domain-containing protein [Mesomycoplasma neurolyticum]VEU59388.1 Hyaluronoglucosaminidase precursor [Mesomycoplasma neurolyticum]
MKKNINKKIKLLLFSSVTLASAVSLIAISSCNYENNTNKDKAKKEVEEQKQKLLSKTIKTEYKVYPLVHEVKYYDKAFELTNVKLNLSEKLDEYTTNKIKEVLQKNNINTSNDSSYDLFVGIYNDNLKLEKILEKNYDNLYKKFDVNKHDAYQMVIKENQIIILAKDSDAAYFAITTLNEILKAKNENYIRELEINDYANIPIRGTIEGYYGIPWGNENRADLMEFGSKVKANAFIFAPKDDPYHREKWHELYPEDDTSEYSINQIAKLAKKGEETKNHFYWTIHPFLGNNKISLKDMAEINNVDLNTFDFAKYKNNNTLNQNVKNLLNKLNQVYDAGVRYFGILADDTGQLNFEAVAKIVQIVEKWRHFKNIADKPLLFVPKHYDIGERNDEKFIKNHKRELDLFDTTFEKNTQIITTGRGTLAPVTQRSITGKFGFKNRQVSDEIKAKGGRRDPVFWLNWPVNDIDRKRHRRLYMSKATILEKGITNLAGLFTNPMEESQPSKNAIFAISDFGWNSDEFDVDKSWEEGFKYFEPDAHEELKELAKHMGYYLVETPWSPKEKWGMEMPESIELEKDIAEYNKAFTYSIAKIKDFFQKSLILKHHYQKIINAAKKFMEKSKQEKLKTEMKKYILPLKTRAEIALDLLRKIEYFKFIQAPEQNRKGVGMPTFDKTWEVDIDKYIEEIDEKIRNIELFNENNTIKTLKYTLYAEAGYHVIKDHLKNLRNKLNGLSKEF